MKLIIFISFLLTFVTCLLGSLQKDESLPDVLKNFNFSSEISHFNHNFIVGGDEAEPHAYPYTVGLSIFTKTGSTIWCGASLIKVNYVLTAAHCLKKARNVIVHIGCHGRNDKDCLKLMTDTDNIIMHEKFNVATFENDIALIKLPSSVILNDNIQLINLPKESLIPEEGRLVIVTGWGYYQDGLPILSNYMRFVNVNIMNQIECRERYQGLPSNKNICIDGSNGKSTCNGDSGGPLVLKKIFNKQYLVGLSSFGAKEGCAKGWPAVFIRITSYLDWINKIISS